MTQPRLVKQINPGIRESKSDGGWSLGQFSAIGELLLFLVSDGLGDQIQLWRSDGTVNGTYRLASDIKGFRNGFIVFEDFLLYTTGQGLWISDGTSAGAWQITPLTNDGDSYGGEVYIDSINKLGDSIVAGSGNGIWIIDQVSQTISLQVPTRTAEWGISIAIGNSIYFAGRDRPADYGVNVELWKSDGTEAGTFRIADIYPGNSTWESSHPSQLTAVGDTLFFVANDGVSGFELWKSDGSNQGTTQVADINPGYASSTVHQLISLGNTLYFSAIDGIHGQELWRSDGTLANTRLVADINSGPNGSSPRELTVVGDTLYFTAFSHSQGGYGLWKSDGTEEGTTHIFTPRSGSTDFYNRTEPRYLTAVGNSVFFSMSESRETGRELWKSDGSEAGTKMVADIFAGSEGSDPRDLKLVGNTLYFSAKSSDSSGRQLWALDVTELLDGSNSGAASFAISGLLAPGNYLHATLNSSDPDGNGSFTYSWQTSSNGSAWTTVGSNRASYRLTANDAGKQLRLLVSYKDGGGFNETVVTAAGTVVYSLTHQTLEILAKDIIYKKTPFAIGFSIEELPGFPYVVNKVWDDTVTGLYALGLSAPNAPSVLVFRGTGDKLDIWDDLNPNGIGFGQFTAAYHGIPVYDSIRQWLRDQDSTFAPIITGHSLGGSLAQWAAADATGNGNINLGEVVTFNSPGISPSQTFAANQFGANVFNPLLAGNVTHYVTSSDLVSLGGTKYLPGNYKLFDYSSLLDPVVGPHLNPVLVPELPVSLKTRPTGGDPVEKPFWFLNSPLYGYNTDIDFIALRLAIAGVAKLAAAIPGIGTVVASIINSVNKALRSRFDTEKLRTSLGEVLYLPGVRPALENAMSFASIAAEAATERVQAAFSALVSGGREALNAIANLPGDVWDEMANATSTTWNALSKWTGNAWRDSVDFSASVWQSLISPAFNFAQPFITTAVKQVFRLPTTPGFLPFAAAASFEPSSAEDQASLDQPAALRTFSLASFDAPAGVQTIDVSVALSQASAELVTLQFQTVDRTALAGVDYRALSGTLQFQPGETEKFVTIELLTPPQASGKDFALRLSNLQNAQFLASEEIVVSLLANQEPVVASAPADRFAPIEESLFFSLPADTFSDANSSDGDVLVYSASLSDGSPLPDWLQFDPETLSFAGTPPASALGSLAITITATDSAQSQASATFALMLVANDGVASFTISGTPAVGNTLTATNSAADPDGNGSFSHTWQASADGTSWNTIGTGAELTIAPAQEGQQLRLLSAYTDGQGFSESVTTAAGSVPFVNDGQATFSITGTPAVGQTLTATVATPDPDGNGSFSHTWQASADGSSWTDVGTGTELTIAQSQEGQQLRLLTTYSDGQGFAESVTTTAGSVPFVNKPPTDLTVSATAFNENIAAGSTVATLATTDPDAGDTFTYSLVAGTGDSDNSAFSINGNQLSIKASPDFETKSSYNLRIRSTDQGGLSVERAVSLTVNDLPDSSTRIEAVGRTILSRATTGQFVVQGVEPGSPQQPISKDGTQIYEGIYGAEWTVLAAEQVNGINQLLWKNTAANRLHVWSLDANWNWTSSAGWDEPTSAAGQQLEAAFGIDLDGNGTVATSKQVVEAAGSVRLALSDGKYWAEPIAAGAAPVAIRNAGVQIYTGIYGPQWQVLGAETVNGINQVLWRETSVNRLHLWTLDANWNRTASSGLIDPASAEAQQLETAFQQDLNADGVIAAATTVVESAGSVQLLKGAANRYSIRGTAAGAAERPITKDGSQIYEGIYGADWTVLAAETVGGVNQVLWKNTAANRLHVWSLDGNWSWTSSAGWDETSSSRAIELEGQFGIDLNGDRTVAQPSSVIEQQGSVWLLQGTGNTYSARSTAAGSTAAAIKKDGVQIAQGIYGNDWQVLAAETINGVNQVLWKNTGANRLHLWSLDATWNWLSSTGWDEPNSAAGQRLESQFGLDLDGNGTIAAPTTTIENKGEISLLSSGSNSAYSALRTTAAGSTPAPISKDGVQIYAGIYGADWTVLAAETIGGVNQVLWKNTGANRLHLWSLDGNWNWLSSTGWDEPNSAAGQRLESQFGIDLDGNGTIASPESTIESAGATRLLASGSNSAYSARSNAPGSTAAPITKDGVQIYAGIYGADWSVLAAETVGGVNQVLWKNIPANRLHVWSLDSSWTWTSSSGWDEPASTTGQQLEAAFGIDLDGNGTIASPTATSITIENKGDIALLIGAGNRYSALSTLPGSSAIPITNGGVQIFDGIYGSEWQVLAADTISGINQVLWRNTAANRLHTWNLDANWSRTSSSGLIDPASHQARELEAQFGLDLDGDGSQRSWISGSTGADLIIGQTTNPRDSFFFSPLGVPASGGVDQIISGGGSNHQFLLSAAAAGGSGNLYANATDADYLLITGFNPSSDQLLLASGKAYGTAPLSLGGNSGTAVFEDRNADGLYSSSSDDLLALLKGVSSYPVSSLLLAG